MNSNKKKSILGNTWWIVTIKGERLIISVNIPARWILILSGAIATAMGYPSITEGLVKLIQAGK